jgi:flagellum-specific peptidoglycan hydrolase FlgJ
MGRQPTPDIIAAAQAASQITKIPASIALGQWALESGWGSSMPPGSNNPFGIKAVGNQPRVVSLTREVVRGKSIFVQQPFRKFDSLEDAFVAHNNLLATSKYYAAARKFLPQVPQFVAAMAKSYATDPNYAKALMAVINGSNLTRYDV